MLPPILAKAEPRKSSRQAGTLICKVVNKTAAVDTFNKMLVIKLCGGSVMVEPVRIEGRARRTYGAEWSSVER